MEPTHHPRRLAAQLPFSSVLKRDARVAIRRFFGPGGAAGTFRVYLDTACVEPLDWRSAWAAVPRRWRGVNDLDREWWPIKYGAQGFLPHMLEQSPFVTSDWRRANASLVVLLVLHLSGSVALTQQRCLARLRQRSAAWQQTSGRAHFFVLTNDRGPCCINGVYKDVEFLRHHVIGNGELPPASWPRGRPLQHQPKVGQREPAPPLPCHEPHKDISIPTPNLHWPRTPLAAPLPARPPPRAARPYLLFHAGWNKFSLCRKQLYWQFGTDASSLVRRQLNATDYATGIARSRFCPICGGYAPFTPRLAEALHAECVPILVSEYWLPPFAELLNYSAFSLRIRLADLPRLRQIALAADHGALVSGVRRARRAFEYHLHAYTGRDMLPLLLYAMHQRLVHSRLPPASARGAAASVARPPAADAPPAWTRVEPLSNSVSAAESYTTRWAVPDGLDGRPPSFRRPVLWQQVGTQIQNLSHNRPRGDATFRLAGGATSAPSQVWACRTAPLNFDARQCVCARVRSAGRAPPPLT